MAKKKSSGNVPSVAEPMSDKERQIKYQTEDDLRSLQRAQEIMDDPTRLKRAKALAEEQRDDTDRVISQLSKRGMISDSQRSKMNKKGKSDE